MSDILDRIASRSSPNADLQGLRTDSIELLVSDAWTIVAAVLAILVIQSHTLAMEKRAAEVATGEAQMRRPLIPAEPSARVSGWSPPEPAPAGPATAMTTDGSRVAARAASVPRPRGDG